MCVGCATIVSGSRGIVDYVRDGETALVVPPGDAEALAAAVRRLLGEPGLRRRLGAAARRFAVESCDNRRYAATIGRLIRDVVARRPPS
jgi:glycosyltransferase involved in cell wall biosynthesis